MKRHSPLRRSTPLIAVSKRQRRFNAEFERAKSPVMLRSRGACEARTPMCTGAGEHVHHISGRLGPAANDPDNLLHVCFACHRYLHAHPLEAYHAGWLVKRNTIVSSLPSLPTEKPSTATLRDTVDGGDVSGSGHGTQGDSAASGLPPFPRAETPAAEISEEEE